MGDLHLPEIDFLSVCVFVCTCLCMDGVQGFHLFLFACTCPCGIDFVYVFVCVEYL